MSGAGMTNRVTLVSFYPGFFGLNLRQISTRKWRSHGSSTCGNNQLVISKFINTVFIKITHNNFFFSSLDPGGFNPCQHIETFDIFKKTNISFGMGNS